MSSDLPWVKWHFAKWRNDECLRMCGLAARGLWADLLAVMHNCKPYGHLVINGRVPTCKQIASLVGMTNEDEVGALLDELETAGVFSRDDNGAIYSRRLVRDNQVRLNGKASGILGGNPVLVSRDCGTVNGGRRGGVNPPTNGTGLPREEERREDKKEPKATPLGASAPRDPNKEFYDQAVPLLISLTGMSRTAAGGFLVKLVRQAKDDRSHVLAALRDADEQRPLQPQGWLLKAVEVRATPPPKFRNPFLQSIADEGMPSLDLGGDPVGLLIESESHAKH